MLKSLSRGIRAKTALGAQLVVIFVAAQAYARLYSSFAFMGGAIASAVLMFIIHNTKTFIEAIPTSKVRSVAIGMAEINGKSLKWKQGFKAPFSGAACLAYEIKEERRVRTGKSEMWVTTRHERKDNHFYLDDGTGKLLCHTKGANLDVKAFERFLGDVKRIELKVLPEKQYYVIGKVVDNPFVKEASSIKAWEDLMMSEGDIYIISDKKEKSLRKWYSWAFLFSTVSTVGFTIASFLL